MRDIVAEVTGALTGRAGVRSVRLVGSRERGTAEALSDWDFALDVEDFAAVARRLPALVAPLEPIVQQWDRLSRHGCYMLMLSGAIKIDLLFEEPHQAEPPWQVRAETLPGIDDHFWDWISWLASKDAAGKEDLVARELLTMSGHLLQPLGVEQAPKGIVEATGLYVGARGEAERRYGVAVLRRVEAEVRQALREHGYGV